LPAARTRPVTSISRTFRGSGLRDRSGRLPSVPRIITPELVEAYSLCPRKAFLLMMGAANPGPHDYELVVPQTGGKFLDR
jgi:hypothetical protein